MTASLCIFCFKYPDDLSPWVKNNPGKNCTYGLGHELPVEPAPIHKQAKKIDKQICVKCSVHIKNPISNSNGCTHEYL